MGFQFNQLVGKPQARLAVEAGAQKGRERQEELNLERNKQAMTMRQLMLEQQKLKASTDISMRDLALREKESKIAADLNELQKVKMSLDIANYETPAQKRSAETQKMKEAEQIKLSADVFREELAAKRDLENPKTKAYIDNLNAQTQKMLQDLSTPEKLSIRDLSGGIKSATELIEAGETIEAEGYRGVNDAEMIARGKEMRQRGTELLDMLTSSVKEKSTTPFAGMSDKELGLEYKKAKESGDTATILSIQAEAKRRKASKK